MDCGGLTKEWLSFAFLDLFDEKHGLWKVSPNKVTV